MRNLTYISNPDKPTWVCTLCNPFMIEIGHVLGRCIVYNQTIDYSKYGFGDERKDIWGQEYKNGAYAVLGGQGHGEDEDAWFLQKPTLYDRDNLGHDWSEFIKEDWTANEAHEYIEFINKNFNYSWDKHGRYEPYFIMLTARLINRFEKKYGTVEKLFQNRLPKIMDQLKEKAKEYDS